MFLSSDPCNVDIANCLWQLLAKEDKVLVTLIWGDREMGTAISCTECSQVAGLIHTIG